MKLKFDWAGAVLPALRTSGALITGNAGVWYALDAGKGIACILMLIVGGTMILVTSIRRA